MEYQPRGRRSLCVEKNGTTKKASEGIDFYTDHEGTYYYNELSVMKEFARLNQSEPLKEFEHGRVIDDGSVDSIIGTSIDMSVDLPIDVEYEESLCE